MAIAVYSIASILGVVALVAANQAALPIMAGQPITGRWEGVGIALFLTPTGGRATLECASGAIAGPLTPDRQGRFGATGTIEVSGPGPQPADVAPTFKKVSYSGRIVADTITLELRVAGEKAMRRFSLKAGSHRRLTRCL